MQLAETIDVRHHADMNIPPQTKIAPGIIRAAKGNKLEARDQESETQSISSKSKTNQLGGEEITGVEARVVGGAQEGPHSSGGGSVNARDHCSP